jgi:Fur family ferric uptake transcriptional regulator
MSTPIDANQRLDALVQEMRSQGTRVTVARRAILTAMVAADTHVTAEDLAATVHGAHPEVHLSTVYRSLESLERLGLVDHVHLGHGRAVFHLADDPHQHLVCEVCGAVIEVPDSTFADLGGELLGGYGFTIRPNHFAVLGRCRSCASQAQPGGNGNTSAPAK